MNKTLNKYSRNVGNFILITGILHLTTGFIENWDVASDILHSGIANTVDETPDRLTFFWFEMSGLFVILLGSFIQQYLNQYKKPIPKKHGYYLLTVGVIGCVLEPVSGFYIFILIALFIISSGNKNFITAHTDMFDNNNSKTK
jgi:hypothetical protein